MDAKGLVTIADRQADAMIVEALRPVLPQAVSTGEEAAAANPGLLHLLAGAPLCAATAEPSRAIMGVGTRALRAGRERASA